MPDAWCGCRKRLTAWVGTLTDAVLSDPEQYFAAGWSHHQTINAGRGVPGLTLAEARKIHR